MASIGRLLWLAALATLCGCAATPQIRLTSGGMSMEVKSKVSILSAVAYAPDSSSLLVGDMDGAFRLWDLRKAAVTTTFRGHTGTVSAVAYSSDAKSVFSLSWDGTLRRWDAATGKQLWAQSGYSSLSWGSLFVSRDNKHVVAGTWSFTRTYRLHDANTGKVLRDLRNDGTIAMSPQGEYIARWTNGGNLELEDTISGASLWKVQLPRVTRISPRSVVFSPDGRRILVAGEVASRPVVTQFITVNAANGVWIRQFGYRHTTELVGDDVASLALSPDGKFVLSADRGSKYKLWEVSSGRLIKQLNAVADAEAKGTINTLDAQVSVAFSPNGRTAAILSTAAARLFDVQTTAELATLIAFQDGEWLGTTSNGYYNSSEKGDEYLSMIVGGKESTIAQLREGFFRPELVKAAIAGRVVADLRRVADVRPPPSVAIVDMPTSVSTDEVVVTLNIIDQGGGIGDVRLYRNGTAVLLESARNLQVAQAGHRARYTVRLESGANNIRAVAFNGDNSMQSADATVAVAASFAPRRPNLYAVAVGIQDFRNPRLKLSYPNADAKLFAETLRSQAFTLYESVNVTLLTTPQETTRESLTQTLRALRDKVRPQDLFVFFVASHGTAEEGEYFLITSNVGALSMERLKADALTQAALKELLANIPASKKFIVIDTCNAGALGDALQVAFLTRGMNDATAIKILGRAVGSTVLSASTSTQEALEGYQGHGLFTYVIAEGLTGKADANKDGFVSTLELASYVDERVPVLAEEIFKHAQYPVVSPSGQGFPLVRVK